MRERWRESVTLKRLADAIRVMGEKREVFHRFVLWGVRGKGEVTHPLSLVVEAKSLPRGSGLQPRKRKSPGQGRWRGGNATREFEQPDKKGPIFPGGGATSPRRAGQTPHRHSKGKRLKTSGKAREDQVKVYKGEMRPGRERSLKRT